MRCSMLTQTQMQGAIQRSVMDLDPGCPVTLQYLRVRMPKGVVATAGDQRMLRRDSIDEGSAG